MVPKIKHNDVDASIMFTSKMQRGSQLAHIISIHKLFHITSTTQYFQRYDHLKTARASLRILAVAVYQS